jgi:hypothetical protein
MPNKGMIECLSLRCSLIIFIVFFAALDVMAVIDD